MWPDHKNRPATSVKTRVLVPAPNQESGSCTGTWDNRGTPAASRRESTVHVKLQPKEPASGERPEPVGLSVPHGACSCQGPDTSTPTPGPSRSWKRPAFGPGPNPQVTRGLSSSSQNEKGSSTPCSPGLSSGASGRSRPATRPPAAGRPHCRPGPRADELSVPSRSAPYTRGGLALAPRQGALSPHVSTRGSEEKETPVNSQGCSPQGHRKMGAKEPPEQPSTPRLAPHAGDLARQGEGRGASPSLTPRQSPPTLPPQQPRDTGASPSPARPLAQPKCRSTAISQSRSRAGCQHRTRAQGLETADAAGTVDAAGTADTAA